LLLSDKRKKKEEKLSQRWAKISQSPLSLSLSLSFSLSLSLAASGGNFEWSVGGYCCCRA
jgi:hypothetical protein